MKRFSAKTFSSRSIALRSIFLSLVAAGPVAIAAPLQEARVSQVIQDVRLLEPQATPRPAIVNDKVTLGRALRTGVESRAELTFTDLTITRLGANTIFSLTAGAREINLKNGTILVQVPAKAGAVKINTASVTVGITGGTALLSMGPPLKFMVLEGVGTIYPKGHPEKAATVQGGEMVLMTADGRFTLPQQFDVSLVLATSHLIIDFPALTNLPLILQVANQQLAEQQLGGTTSQLLVKNLIDVIDVTDQSATANPIVLAARGVTPTPTPTPPPPTPTPPPPTPTPPPPTPTPPPPTPTPTPSKFGPPSVITSPVPYPITSGTVITTDPSITTNGVTNFGKIYRGPTDDGAFSLWAFGSTSAFDTALNIDTNFFANPNNLPIAVFKFQSLSLIGNPTIDLSNGGATKLGLVAVDGITSGPPGGTLTFSGLDTVALATVNGPITLTSDISFDALSLLAMYARGAGSNLTIDSPISNIGDLELAAEGSIQLTNPGTMSVGAFGATAGDDLTLQIGGSLMLNGKVRLETLVLPGTTIASGANLTLNITGDYTNSSTTDFSRLRVMNDGAHIGTGGNIAVNIGGNLTTTGPVDDFVLLVQNTSGQIDNGGNISLAVGGSISVSGALNTTLDNTGGLIGTDTSMTVTSVGALAVQGDASFQILNSDNGTGGSPGQIGGNATIDVSSGGDFSANSLTGFINDRHGGSIGGSAVVAFNIGGALSTTTDVFAGISTRNDGTGGGTIGSNATVDISAASVSVGGGFTTFVSTAGGGSITGNASNTVNVAGNLVVQGPILAVIDDQGFNQINPINFIAGGHIGGDATVTLSAQNITTSSTASGIPGQDIMALEASIYPNGSGTIGGSAIVNVLASQNITAPGTTFFTVANGNFMGTGGGTIGGDATLNISAVNLTTGTLFADIYNYGGAHIGGSANINFNLSGNLTTQSDANFLIDNSNGGSIGASTEGGATINMNVSGSTAVTGNATFQILGSDGATSAAINFNGGSYGVGGTFLSSIDANGTITFNNASVHANVLQIGALGANGVLNIGGGTLSADTTLKLYAPGSNGQLNFVSNVTLGGAGAKILAANSVTIFNSVVVTIGGSTPADVYTNHANYTGSGGNDSTTGTFSGLVNNPQPLSSAPAFSDPPPATVTTAAASTTTTTAKAPTLSTTSGTTSTTVKSPTLATTSGTTSTKISPTTLSGSKTTSTKATSTTINVSSTAELLSLLDEASVGPDGKATISGSKSTSNLKNLSGTNINGLSGAEHRMVIQQMHDRDTTRLSGKRLL
jgi:hypothetical protein